MSRHFSMKTLCIVVVGTSLMFATGSAPQSFGAQDTAPTSSDNTAPASDDEATDNRSAEDEAEKSPEDVARSELFKLTTLYEEAAKTGDPAKLKEHLDPQFTGVMVTNEEVKGFDGVEQYWDKIQGLLGKGGKYTVDVNVDGKAMVDGDLAIAHGTTKDIAVTASGKEFKFNGQWTAVCRRSADGQWKILRIHGSMNPLDNPFISALGGSTNLLTGAIAGVAGLLLGIVATRLMVGKSGK